MGGSSRLAPGNRPSAAQILMLDSPAPNRSATSRTLNILSSLPLAITSGNVTGPSYYLKSDFTLLTIPAQAKSNRCVIFILTKSNGYVKLHHQLSERIRIMQTSNQNQPQRSAWKDAKATNTEAGAVLIKKACEHVTCSHFKCERKDLRYNGIAI
jgi:hypothetical protein